MMLDPHVVCAGGGVLLDQWFTQQEWDTRSRAHQRMRDLGSYRSRGAGDYTLTDQIVQHPRQPELTARVAEYKWK